MNSFPRAAPATRRAAAALSIAALLCSCIHQPEEMPRSNPFDQGGVNWHPPVVAAMADTTVSINDTITITAAGSDNGSVVKYMWAKNGTDYADTTTSGALTVDVGWPGSGRQAVLVKAVDNDGVASSPDSCVVTVLLDPPIPDAGPDTTVSVNDTVRLHGSATDGFGYIDSWAWDIGNTGTFIVMAHGDFSFTAPAAENLSYLCVLRATDDDGSTALDTVRIIVLQDNPAPYAGPDTTVSVNDTVRLHGSATDGFGTVTSLAWDVGNTGTFIATAGDTTFVAPASENLDYQCVLQAADDDGNMAFDTVRILVLQDNPVPYAGPDTTVSVNDTIRLHGSAVDGFGYITSLTWDVGNTGTFVVSSTGDTAFAAPASENLDYQCVLQAADEEGNTALDTVRILVRQDVPVANAGRDTAVWINDTVLLHGGATQLFGSIVSWEWKIGSGSWTMTGGPDTMAVMPDSEQTVVCSLAVIDDDGNRGVDGMNAVVYRHKVISAAAGWYHSLFLRSNGSLWACGSNIFGQYGNGTTTGSATPVQVMSGVRSAAAGYGHTLILMSDSTLWACGANSNGQLGIGTTVNSSVPVLVMNGVRCMAAGGYHSLIVKGDGTLWTCGANYYGQLGIGTTTTSYIPVLVTDNVMSAAAGGYHSLFLKNDGTLWSCGNNNYGQLGDGTVSDRHSPLQVMSGVLSIGTGGSNSHSLVLKNDSTLWAWGYNSYGSLGDGTATARYSPVQVISHVQCASAGGYHSLIVKGDGTLWACGRNYDYQLGDGTTTDRLSPIKIFPINY